MRGIRYIASDCRNVRALRKLIADRAQSLRIARCEDEIPPSAGKTSGDCEAEAAGRSGDQGGPFV
jgi:hypothetical protein